MENLSSIFQSVDTTLEDMLDTIKNYFENKMSIKETAEAMFIHRSYY